LSADTIEAPQFPISGGPILEREWRRCTPWIKGALTYARGAFLLEDVRAAVERGDAQFWPGANSAVVTEVQTFPRLKSLHFWLVGGELPELLNRLRPAIEFWGILQGCTGFSTAGREGWQRAMRPYGYEPAYHVTIKDTRQ
jgi:hypothetical protein